MRDHWTDRLSEYLDDELDAAERAAADAHLAACDECARTLAELRSVVARAAALPDRPPATDLWPQIAAAIGAAPAATQPKVIDISKRRRAAPRLSFTLPQLAVAALGLMLLSAGGAWVLLGERAASPAAVATESAQHGAVVAINNRPAADLDRAVADLEELLGEGRTRLAPETVQALEDNLRLVDQAIAEARAALERDPNSEYLNTYLADSMRRKLSLLRHSTAALRAST